MMEEVRTGREGERVARGGIIEVRARVTGGEEAAERQEFVREERRERAARAGPSGGVAESSVGSRVKGSRRGRTAEPAMADAIPGENSDA